MGNALTVLIDAPLVGRGMDGSLEQVLIGLVSGLARLDGGDHYRIVSHWKAPDLLAPYLGPNQTVTPIPRPRRSLKETVKQCLGPLRAPLGRLRRRVARREPVAPSYGVGLSGGFYESLGADLLHLPSLDHYIQADVPSAFTVFDLQHRHLPQFFTPSAVTWRDNLLSRAFAHVRAVVTASRWVREDVIKQYGVPPERVFSIPLGSATDAYQPVSPEKLASVRRRYRLPERFALYPAITAQHKNHPRLLEAMDILRRRGDTHLHLVCTGRKCWPWMVRRFDELGLRDRVAFLGFVPAEDLRALYRLCEFLVFPTMFEGAGMPVIEAMREGVPVACSDIPPVREYAGDAAWTFDPMEPEAIADAMARLAGDPGLRDDLRRRGLAQGARFTQERNARMHRTVYRKVAGREPSEEDRGLLAEMTAS
jgi:glycosyltransferase involved in cell wall biosynthesis